MLRTLIRYGGSAAVLGGALYVATFGMVFLIYGLFEEQTGGAYPLGYGFIYAFYAPMYVALSLGTLTLHL